MMDQAPTEHSKDALTWNNDMVPNFEKKMVPSEFPHLESGVLSIKGSTGVSH